MIAYGRAPFIGDWLFSLSVPSLGDLRLGPRSLPSPHFACLLACDARQWSDEAILAVAEHLLDRGLAYFCAWGPESKRVHDLVDRVIARRELDGLDYLPGVYELRYPVMTVWDEEETLDDALWYLLVAAYPDDAYAATCKSRLAMSVGNAKWASEIEAQLRSASDPGSSLR